MKAVIYRGREEVAVEDVPAPRLEAATDAIVRITAAAICGTDVRLYWGTMTSLIPLEPGDPLGHEFVGVVEEVGADVRGFRAGDRVVSPFSEHCGRCFFCERDLLTRCENMRAFGLGAAWGGLGGGQAEFVRVPSADRLLLPLDERVSDVAATVLPDVMSGVFAGMEGIRAGDVVAVVGCGPTGLAAILCARLHGAARIFAIDHHADRLAVAAGAGATPIDFDATDPVEVVKAATGGRGADVVADATGRQGSIAAALRLVRGYGVIVLLGYVDPTETCSIGEIGLRHVAIRPSLVPPVRKVQARVMRLIAEGRLDPSPLLSHVLPLEQAPRAYRMMAERQDGARKIVLRPGG